MMATRLRFLMSTLRPPSATTLRVAGILGAALVAGLALRLVGLDYGITYGPDQEPAVARALLHVQGHLHPNFFRYPSFYPYLLAAIFWVYARLTGSPVPVDMDAVFEIRLSAGDPATMHLQPYYLVGRGVTVSLALGTILLVYLTGRELYGRKVGALGALFLALAPLHIWDSHYVAVDIPATFWITLSAYAAARMMREPRLRWCLLSGIAAGWAAGTKYPGALEVMFPLTALSLQAIESARRCPRCSGMPRALAFLFAGIGLLSMAAGVFVWAFPDRVIDLLIPLTTDGTLPSMIPALLGGWIPTLALACGAFMVSASLCLYKGKPRAVLAMLRAFDWGAVVTVLVTAAVAFVLVVPYSILDPRAFLDGLFSELTHSGAGHYGFDPIPRSLNMRGLYFLRSGLPFALGLPLYLSAIGGVLMAILRRQRADWLLLAFLASYYAISGLGNLVFLRYLIPLLPFLTLLAARVLMTALDSRVNLSRLAGVVALLVIVGYTVLFALTTTLRYAHDTRDEAAEMIKGSFAAGTAIAMTEFPNYYPVIDEGRLELVACPQGTHDAYALVDCNADVVVLSGMLFWRPYRSPEIFGDQYAGYEALRQGALGYRRVASFRQGFLNKNLYTALDPMFEGYYVSPTIEIYERVRDG